MQLGVMITDGGAHPPEKWAVMTAETIFPLGDALKGDRALLARKVQLAIAEALMPHHESHQDNERAALETHGDAHLDRAHDPIPRAEEALEAVKNCIRGTPWEDKIMDAAWLNLVGGILATHFATSADIERQWHCHRNPSEKAQAFLAARNGGAN